MKVMDEGVSSPGPTENLKAYFLEASDLKYKLLTLSSFGRHECMQTYTVIKSGQA